MTATEKPERRKGPAPWIVLLALMAVPAFMYVSIMFKIIKFGP